MARKWNVFSALIFSLVLGPIGLSQVWADSLTVLEDLSNPKTATGLIDINITGNEMGGIGLTIFFVDNTTTTGTWNEIGTTSGGVQQSSWSFIQAGDTKLGTPWTFTNQSENEVVGFSIDGISGNTVFDIVDDPMVTEASGFGSVLTLLSEDAGLDVQATFSEPVVLEGDTNCIQDGVAEPCGDLFGTLNMEFLNGGSLGQGQQFSFSVDTDQFAFPLPPSIQGPNTPAGVPDFPTMTPSANTAVPEPSSLLLLGTGVAAFLFVRKHCF